MSIDAHPNLQAVQFTVAICTPIFQSKRPATKIEVLDAYYAALRGKATPETNIDIDGMIESFTVLIDDRLRYGTIEDVRDFIIRFVTEVSTRLDEELHGPPKTAGEARNPG